MPSLRFFLLLLLAAAAVNISLAESPSYDTVTLTSEAELTRYFHACSEGDVETVRQMLKEDRGE